MALTDAAMILAANALRAGMTHAQIHSGDPGSAGTSNAISGPSRQAVTWAAATADGDFSLSSTVAFTGAPANNAVTWVSLWSAAGSGSPPTGGTFYARYALSGDATANAAGEYNVTQLTVNGSAT
jgi:hypothetical protein